MARTKKSSPAEDFVDLVARLPWWAGSGLAVVSYFGLNAIASAPLPVIRASTDMGEIVSGGLGRGLAHAGQYILPVLFTLGAAISALRRHKRRALLKQVNASPTIDALEGLTWKEFELLVGEGFRAQGYAVHESGGGGADGGVDLVLSKNGDKLLGQCKQWRAFKVGVSVVRELYGVMAAGGAAGGLVVTSGQFTSEAAQFASGRNVRLINGNALLELLRQGRGARAVNGQSSSDTSMKRSSSPIQTGTAPSCPVCAQLMVRRVAKRGHSAGSPFWGCSTYPQCKGTRPD